MFISKWIGLPVPQCSLKFKSLSFLQERRGEDQKTCSALLQERLQKWQTANCFLFLLRQFWMHPLTQCPAPAWDVKLRAMTFSSECWPHGTFLPELQYESPGAEVLSRFSYKKCICQLDSTLHLQWDALSFASCLQLLCPATLHRWVLCSSLELGVVQWWLKGSYAVLKSNLRALWMESASHVKKLVLSVVTIRLKSWNVKGSFILVKCKHGVC